MNFLSSILDKGVLWTNLFASLPRLHVHPIRYRRATGCWVSPAKLQWKFEKQFTKMTAHKHGINFMVPTCGVNNPKEVNVVIKKSKSSRMNVNERRNIVLAATLFPHISELVNSGELGDEFNQLEINLARLEVARDFSSLKLFWFGEQTNKIIDKETEAKLIRLGVAIREALVAASVLPSVPPIVFVLDRPEQEKRRLLQALESIDLGPDYVRSEPESEIESMRSEPEKLPEWLRNRKKSAPISTDAQTETK